MATPRRLPAFALLLLCGCVTVVDRPLPPGEGAAPPTPRTASVEEVAAWLSGRFSSRSQAAADPRFREVLLSVVPIWPDRTDGPWLYVEQAVATAPGRPYRQRIYQLSPTGGSEPAGSPAAPGHPPAGGGVLSIVYEIPGDPLRYAGAWQAPHRFNDLEPGLLEVRVGCAVRLHPQGPDRYSGGTEGSGCVSTLAGAAYATSEVVLTAEWIETLDRGFDASGAQVWGSEHGPYRFERVAQ